MWTLFSWILFFDIRSPKSKDTAHVILAVGVSGFLLLGIISFCSELQIKCKRKWYICIWGQHGLQSGPRAVTYVFYNDQYISFYQDWTPFEYMEATFMYIRLMSLKKSWEHFEAEKRHLWCFALFEIWGNTGYDNKLIFCQVCKNASCSSFIKNCSGTNYKNYSFRSCHCKIETLKYSDFIYNLKIHLSQF